jgi:hypothetical protein
MTCRPLGQDVVVSAPLRAILKGMLVRDGVVSSGECRLLRDSPVSLMPY